MNELNADRYDPPMENLDLVAATLTAAWAQKCNWEQEHPGAYVDAFLDMRRTLLERGRY